MLSIPQVVFLSKGSLPMTVLNFQKKKNVDEI